MKRRTCRLTAASTVALATVAAAVAAPATASTKPAPTYTVSVGSHGSWNNPDDTPASSFIDKDGTYYYQEAHSLYGAGAPRAWTFYSGTNFDTAKRSSISDAVNPTNPQDSNADTTWRCNNSPTGKEATKAPEGSGYVEQNYCDLVGVWVDPDTGDWYGLIHNEFTPQPFGDGLHYDSIDYAVSTDQGRAWQIKSHIITSPYSTKRGDTAAFPEQTYYYGDGDPRLYVDTRSGYFYVYYGSRVVNKGGSWVAFYSHVARAPISAKMSPGSWTKFYDGHWSQPGQGGKESNLVPVTADNPKGYTPPSKEYKPTTPGTAQQQVANGTAPATSPLFVMDITYDAYLGKYIGEPQGVDQSGNAPQQLYVTDNLATQKWHLLGDTGSYHTASWYRWFLDSANKTSSSIVGKDFREYCSYGCSDGRYGEYVNLTIGSNETAHPVDTSRSYEISARGWMLAQKPHSNRTTAVHHRGALTSWRFAANGDGSYRIVNDATHELLGVDSSGTAGRAWGARPTLAAPAGEATVGRQWWILPNTSAADGSSTGTVEIVNRYSGLVLDVSNHQGHRVETAAPRSWTQHGSGAPARASEQQLSLTPRD